MATDKKGLTVVELTARNVMRLHAVHVKPGPDGLVVVGGRNAQGKSSVLNAIAMAIGGKRLCPDEPLRRGAKEGSVTVTLGRGMAPEIEVERRVTRTGTTLRVRDLTGEIKSPQGLLDSLTSALTFDPLAFTRMDEAEQARTLRQIAGVDTATLDAQIKGAREDRTLANRDAASAKARLAAMADVEAPDTPVDVRGLSRELTAALGVKHQQEARREAVLHLVQVSIPEQRERTESLRRQMELAEARLRDLEAAATAAGAEVAALVSPDIDGLQQRMEDAQRINGLVAQKQARKEVAAQADVAQAASEDLSRRMADLEEQKAALLSQLKLPVDGLCFAGDEVTYNGIPFSQASQAEQLRVSTAIAVAQNADLKVMLIRDGSLLDAGNMQTLAEMAQEAGCQVWIERVGAGEETTFVIEDGRVQGAEAEADGSQDA